MHLGEEDSTCQAGVGTPLLFPSPDKIWNVLPPCAVHGEPLILGALPWVVAREELPGFCPREGVQTLGVRARVERSWDLQRPAKRVSPNAMPAPCPPMPSSARARPWGPYPLQDVDTNEVSWLGQQTVLIKEAIPFCLVNGWFSLHLAKTITSALC